MKLPRHFDAVEVRVLGALLEKEQATPEYYPLTLNALTAACNQKSNRDPVMDLSAADVRGALDRLHEDVLVWQVSTGRSERWRHSLERRWQLDPPSKAVITLLLLRGPQTPGEIRGRSERLHTFGSTDQVEEIMRRLASGDEPLITRLERRPGQKEARWTHLVGETPAADPAPPPSMPKASRPRLDDRIRELEERVAELERQLATLQALLD